MVARTLDRLKAQIPRDAVIDMDDQVAGVQVEKAVDRPPFEPFAGPRRPTDFDPVEQLVVAQDQDPVPDQPEPASHRPKAERHPRDKFGD